MKRFILLFTILVSLALSGCNGGSSSGAAAAVEGYTQALIDKDTNRLSTLSCAAWEENALAELESFGAITATLEGLDCQESGKDGETTLVACQGKITANYGNEVLEINLADRSYMVVFENGEWRMCGYR